MRTETVTPPPPTRREEASLHQPSAAAVSSAVALTRGAQPSVERSGSQAAHSAHRGGLGDRFSATAEWPSPQTAPGATRSRELLPRGAAFCLPFVAAVAVRLVTGARPVDDAYITFRYARNLAEGAGLVYNPGEWVLGTTTPLWAALLALLHRLGATDLPATALAVAAPLDGVTAGLLALLALRLGYPWWGGALVGVAWALNPLSVAYAAGGMETSVFVLLVVGALTLAASGRATLAAALAGVGVLVRPEAGLLAGVIVIHACWRQRGLALAPLLVAAVPVLVWAGVCTAIYGSPVPQTVLAKQGAYQNQAPWTSALMLLVHAGLPGWSNFSLAALPTFSSIVLAPLAVGTLMVLGRRALPLLRGRRVPWQLFAGFALAYLLFHGLGGFRGARLFPWYLVPLIPVYMLLVAAGCRGISRRHGAWVGALVLVLWQVIAVDWLNPFGPAGFDLRREALYAQVGAELRRDLPPGATVAAPEIGALGYLSGLRMLDTVGLVSPVASRYYPLAPHQVEGDNAIPPHLIRDQAPDAVVTLDQFARKALLLDPRFQARYRLERAYPAPIWLSQNLLVFRRVD